MQPSTLKKRIDVEMQGGRHKSLRVKPVGKTGQKESKVGGQALLSSGGYNFYFKKSFSLAGISETGANYIVTPVTHK
jgi:hypothetical protein